MSISLLYMTRDLVLALIQSGHVSPETLQDQLHATYDTLSKLHTSEVDQEGETVVPHATTVPADPLDWKRSIMKHVIICLECGQTFRQLSSRHLRVHDLDSRAYRRKYGIPSTQPLSSRQATARRRQLAQQIRPWEKVRAGRKATKKARK